MHRPHPYAAFALYGFNFQASVAIHLSSANAVAFQNILHKIEHPSALASSKPAASLALENELLDAIDSLGKENRLANSDKIASLVTELEESGSSITRPAVAPEVMGRWRLLHTTNANTSSPIQRKAVDASKFQIYQDINFSNAQPEQLLVSQVVKFGDKSELRLDALASTSAFPLPELTERKSTGKVFGLNILGVSLVGEEAQPDPNQPDSRIDFVFDEGNFDFNGIKIPYPVPFRSPLFRDLVKGWIDITYLSDRLRVSRGNKGTTFILLKED